MGCLLVWDGKDHRPLGKQILYHHYVFITLVRYRKIHYVNAQNLEWSGYKDEMQQGLVRSTASHNNGTLGAGLRKSLGIAKHPFPPPSSQCVVETLAREVVIIGAGVGFPVSVDAGALAQPPSSGFSV